LTPPPGPGSNARPGSELHARIIKASILIFFRSFLSLIIAVSGNLYLEYMSRHRRGCHWSVTHL